MFGIFKKKRQETRLYRWEKPSTNILPIIAYKPFQSPICIQGKQAAQSHMIPFKSVLTPYFDSLQGLPIAIGLSDDNPVYLQLDRLPHLLIAGSTGSGKSVLINNIIAACMFRFFPGELSLHLIDCKQVEFSHYKNSPFTGDIACDPVSAKRLLENAVYTMECRYNQMTVSGCKVWQGNKDLIIIDELSDLILQEKSCKNLIIKLAQKARAAGIYLIVATQSPKRQILDGLIKANFPCVIGLKTANYTESVCIMGEKGLEDIMEKGNAVIKYGSEKIPVKIPLITDTEIDLIDRYWIEQKEKQD